MTTEIAALVRQMRDALVEAWPIIPRGYRLDRAKTAVSAADQWLAQQRGPLTDKEIARMWMAGYSDGSGDSMVNLFARAIERVVRKQYE